MCNTVCFRSFIDLISTTRYFRSTQPLLLLDISCITKMDTVTAPNHQPIHHFKEIEKWLLHIVCHGVKSALFFKILAASFARMPNFFVSDSFRTSTTFKLARELDEELSYSEIQLINRRKAELPLKEI